MLNRYIAVDNLIKKILYLASTLGLKIFYALQF